MSPHAPSRPRPRAVAPGVFHLPLASDAEAWFLDDGRYESDPARDCAWNADPADVRRALVDAGLPESPLRLRVTPTLLRWRGQYVLIDAGCADAYGPGLGLLPQRLEALGVRGSDIAYVLFTHLHLDHIAGALEPKSGGLCFPRARLFAERKELAFWRQPNPDASQTQLSQEQVAGILKQIQARLEGLSAQLEVFDAGDELLPGIRAIATPGHTPHHVAFECAARETELVCAGDAFVEPALHVSHPEWRTAGDMAPQFLAQSRTALLERATARNQWLTAYHFPLPSVGTVFKKSRDGFGFHLARWDWADL